MRNHMSFGLAIALAAMFGGCTKSAQSGTANADSAKQAIKADQATWDKQFQAKDTEGAASHYAEEAYLVAPGVAGTEGMIPIRQILANASTDPNFELHFTSEKIDASGDLAYARGKFTGKYTDKKTAKVMSDSGSYLTVYRKQSDGSWKAVEDFAAADPDTTKPVEPGKAVTHTKMVSGV